MCVFTHFTVDVKLTTRSIFVLRHRRRSETQRLRVFWLCEDFFFLFVGILSGTLALLGFGGWGVFFLSDTWVVPSLNSISLQCYV